VCACACVCVSIVSKHSQVVWASAWWSTGCRVNSRSRQFGVVASLSKKLYSHCSSLPILRPSVNWGNSLPSCNIRGYLLITGEVNTQLSLSHLAKCGTMGFATSVCETWAILLWHITLNRRVWCIRLKCLSSPRHPSVGTLGNKYL